MVEVVVLILLHSQMGWGQFNPMMLMNGGMGGGAMGGGAGNGMMDQSMMNPMMAAVSRSHLCS
jgi:hypothetical protein